VRRGLDEGDRTGQDRDIEDDNQQPVRETRPRPTGRGIGKGDGPEGKRPNLESIVKKSLKWREHQALYLPAINAATIRATAEQLLAA